MIDVEKLAQELREVGRDGVWKSGLKPANTHPVCAKAADAILALAEREKRMREALERIALSGDGEDVFERSTLYGTFQTIARNALIKEPKP